MGITEISILRPAEIESESFRIIEEELRQKGRKIPEDYKHILLRVIHTTADFEYLDTLVFRRAILDSVIYVGNLARIITLLEAEALPGGTDDTSQIGRR